MYAIFSHVWLIFMVHVGKYTVYGWYGKCCSQIFVPEDTASRDKMSSCSVDPTWAPFAQWKSPQQLSTDWCNIFFHITSSMISILQESHQVVFYSGEIAELPTSWNILMQKKRVPRIWQTLQTPGTPLQSRMSKSTNPSSRKTMTSFARSDGWKSFRFSWICLYHRIHGTGIFTYMYHTNQPNVGAYIIHGSYAGMGSKLLLTCQQHLKTRIIWVRFSSFIPWKKNTVTTTST